MEGPPVIDIGLFLESSRENANAEAQNEVLNKVREAAESFGLFQVVNHGVDPLLLKEVLENAQQFFGLPLDQKLKYQTDSHPFGYVHKSLLFEGSTEEKEHLFSALEDDHPKNVCPETPSSFRKNYVELGRQMENAAKLVLSIISKSISLDEDVLSSSPAESYINTLFYPGIADFEGPILSQHQDATIVTLVSQLNMVAGYQVCKDEEWYTVVPQEATLIVNFGDLIQVFTNGRYKSALHRIVAKKQDRFSFVYMITPGKDVQISPLAEFTRSEPPRYRSFRYGEYLQLRFDNKKVGKDIGIWDYESK